MKRCPTCQTSYEDGLVFCRLDGAALVPESLPVSAAGPQPAPVVAPQEPDPEADGPELAGDLADAETPPPEIIAALQEVTSAENEAAPAAVAIPPPTPRGASAPRMDSTDVEFLLRAARRPWVPWAAVGGLLLLVGVVVALVWGGSAAERTVSKAKADQQRQSLAAAQATSVAGSVGEASSSTETTASTNAAGAGVSAPAVDPAEQAKDATTESAGTTPTDASAADAPVAAVTPDAAAPLTRPDAGVPDQRATKAVAASQAPKAKVARKKQTRRRRRATVRRSSTRRAKAAARARRRQRARKARRARKKYRTIDPFAE